MKKIYINSIIDGIIRAFIIWITIGVFFSENIQNEWLLFTIVVVGIVLSCISLIYIVHINKNNLIIRFGISILVCVLVVFILFLKIPFPFKLRATEPGAGVGLMIYFYVIFFTIINVITRVFLLIYCFIKRCK